MEYYNNLILRFEDFNNLKNFVILKAVHGDIGTAWESIRITMSRPFLHVKKSTVITVSPTVETFIWLVKAFKEEFEKIPCRIDFADHSVICQSSHGFTLFDNNLKFLKHHNY